MTGKNNVIQSVTSAVPTGTFAPTASSLAGWDANTNISGTNVLAGYTTTALAGATTTLTVASTYMQAFTGSTTNQTLTLPVTSTLALGQSFLVMNQGTGVCTLTVKSSGGNTILILQPPCSPTLFTCILTSGTTAASWQVSQLVYIDNNNNITIGEGAGNAIAGGSSTTSIYIGTRTGYACTSSGNVAIGNNAFLGGASGYNNVFLGANAAVSAGTTPGLCTIIGHNAYNNVTGTGHVVIGATTCPNHQADKAMTVVGYNAFSQLSGTGGYMTSLGANCGNNNDNGNETSNIYIGYNCLGTSGDQNVLVIGAATGTGNGQLNSSTIHGIKGNTQNTGASVALVTINTTSSLLGITTATTLNSIWTITSVAHAASPYTVLATDYFLAVDCSGGVVTLKLPNAPTTGKVYRIKDSTGNAGTNNITVTTVGGTVTLDGSTSVVMSANYSSINVIFDGSNYEIF